jgi:HD-like signal output (HDOD) protein
MKGNKITPQAVEKEVNNLTTLSTLPHIAYKVIELIDNSRISVSDLADIISVDHILTARILKLANSGYPRQISTLNHAIVVLGFNAIKDLVLGISAVDQVSTKHYYKNLDVAKFWRHAVFVGYGAKFLSKFLDYPVVGEVFVAGLLHDIGHIILLQQYPAEFIQISQTVNDKRIPFHEAEKEYLGFDHADAGAWLAEGWQFPEKFVHAIRYQHKPQAATKYIELVKIIHIADLISYSIDEGLRKMKIEEKQNDIIVQKINDYFSKNGKPLSFFQKYIKLETEKSNHFLKLLMREEVDL